MKTLIKAMLIVLALSFTTLWGHGGGHMPTQKEVSKSNIQKTAKQELLGLLKYKKIDKSWSNKPISNMKRTQYNYNNEWVVSFENLEIKDKTKQTLYIFVDVYGDIKGANYTGK